MNNITFGKPMEKIRKGINLRLVNNARDKKYVSEPIFVS